LRVRRSRALRSGRATPAQECVPEQTCEHRDGEVAAEDVLRAFAVRGPGAERVRELRLHTTQQRHADRARRDEDDSEHARVGLRPGPELGDRLVGDVGGEQEELDRHYPMCSRLRLGRVKPPTLNAPSEEPILDAVDIGGRSVDVDSAARRPSRQQNRLLSRR
jgi:hypothetical protein